VVARREAHAHVEFLCQFVVRAEQVRFRIVGSGRGPWLSDRLIAQLTL